MHSDMREGILKAQLQRELQSARSLESEGKFREAGVHYTKAAALYRMVGKNKAEAPQSEAAGSMDIAGQYDAIGQAMKSPARSQEGSPESYGQAVSSLIVVQKPDTKWADIGGLDDAKDAVKEAIILPFINDKPKFIRSPKSILLYGPPGNGKTLIAKASSNVLGATFFEARASTLLSKYFGESGKLISALFSKARNLQPAMVFIDEIDAMASSRDGGSGDASRRVLSEFLTEMDGFGTRKDDKVMVMAATNKPWDLDEALLSRFQRKIYIPMPDEGARRNVAKIHLGGTQLSGASLEWIAQVTDFYSGRDIMNLCEEAVIGMVRECNPGLQDLESRQLERYSMKTRPLDKADFERALEKIKPSVSTEDIERFLDWQKSFGGA